MRTGGALFLCVLLAACGSVPNNFADASPEDCDDHNPCTVDGADASGCTHTAGNSGTVCREAAGDCDVAETCDGTSDACPADELATGDVCRPAAAGNPCDIAETCAGDSPDCPPDVAPAEILFGATGGHADFATAPASELYEISTADGSIVRDIGPIGFGITGLAVDPTSGLLYGTTAAHDATAPESLVLIDPATGAGTLIGTHTLRLADITFDSTGQLYGWAEAGDDLATIDKATGTGAMMADSTMNTAGSGLAFTPDGELWFAGDLVTFPATLTRVDPSTGAIAQRVAQITGVTADRYTALAADRQGRLYGVARQTTSGGGVGVVTGPPSLFTVDTTSAVATVVGPTIVDLDGIAFGCAP